MQQSLQKYAVGLERMSGRVFDVCASLDAEVAPRVSLMRPGSRPSEPFQIGDWSSDSANSLSLTIWVDDEPKRIEFRWRDAFDITELTKAGREREGIDGVWRAEDADYHLDRLEPLIRSAILELIDTPAQVVTTDERSR